MRYIHRLARGYLVQLSKTTLRFGCPIEFFLCFLGYLLMNIMVAYHLSTTHDGEVPLSAFSKDTTCKLAGFIITLNPL